MNLFKFSGQVDYNLTLRGGAELIGFGKLLYCTSNGSNNTQKGIINSPFFNSSQTAINIEFLSLQSDMVFNIGKTKGNSPTGVLKTSGDFGKLQINGDIIGTSSTSVCLDIRFASLNIKTSKLNIKGKIINTALDCTYLIILQTNAVELSISGYVFGDCTTHLIKVVDPGAALNLIDFILYNSGSGSGIFTVAGADVRLSNVLSELQIANSFIQASFPANVMLNNVRSNKDVQPTNIIDLLSPSGFIYDTNLTVPKLY